MTLALLLLAALPAAAARHKLSFKFLDGEAEYVRNLNAVELQQADSAAAGEASGRPLLISAVVSKPSGGVHLVEYQIAYDDRVGRTFDARGALTLARGERLRVVTCDGYAVEIGLDATKGPAWPAGDSKNYRLSAALERDGRKRACRATSRLGTQFNLKTSSGRKGRASSFRLNTVLSGEDYALVLEHRLEDVAPGSEKLTLQKTETLTVGRKTKRGDEGYDLTWHAEAPPPKPKPAQAPAPKAYTPVPRLRLQRGAGIGINDLSGGRSGAAAPAIPVIQAPGGAEAPRD